MNREDKQVTDLRAEHASMQRTTPGQSHLLDITARAPQVEEQRNHGLDLSFWDRLRAATGQEVEGEGLTNNSTTVKEVLGEG